MTKARMKRSRRGLLLWAAGLAGWSAACVTGDVAAAGNAGAATSPAKAPSASTRPAFSGVYPHLAMFNNEGECGTGAVVPWAGRLWAITYAPHKPNGSSDKLYEIADDLTQIVRPESVGGTPASRLIHRESNQLFIGPYAIDAGRTVRVIKPSAMPGRLTASARHLTDPAGKIYFATMEEGFYEVDVKTLGVKELYPDANKLKDHAGPLLPGYHGKGAYSGQGRLVYANNGELSPEAQRKPDIASGCLAEWDGKAWTVVRRNQFTDVTGPGGIYGNEQPATDPIWSIGWDYRSLILMTRDAATGWHAFRLPKPTHTYDGAHGWNTEWPRIRDVGEADLLMTMHGGFWRFPKTFSASTAAGIRPRSTYLKVVGDFARWNDKLVLGCDDSAQSEFLNKRKAKGDLVGPGQSQSNLWFLDPAKLDDLGPVVGKGAVWASEPVKANAWSDPYLFAGYDRRAVHLSHGADAAVTFEFEVDENGTGQWKPLRSVEVPAKGYAWVDFPAEQKGEWIRVRADRDAAGVTAWFHYANADRRKAGEADPMFASLAKAGDAKAMAGLVRARGENKRTLHLAATAVDGTTSTDVGYYELDGDAKLRKVDDAAAHQFVISKVAVPRDVLKVEPSSVLFVDDAGKRWRLPKGDAAFDALTAAGAYRVDREVSTERDVFNCHGTFYELPADNAGGFGKVRPISTHNLRINDYCSYRGMLVLTGIAADGVVDRLEGKSHVVRSDDGKAAVWLGAIDDLWKLGKPVGRGGPWKDEAVKAGKPSDPYLMTGYDAKRLTLSTTAAKAVSVKVEIDVAGDGRWVTYKSIDVPAGGKAEHVFPPAFQACWARLTADTGCAATATFDYE